jgi:hypothetical protein
MTLRAHSLRYEVAAVQQQFHLLCASPLWFTPTDDFMPRRVLNRDGMNKLSQLSTSVNLTFWVICLGYVSVYVDQCFRTINRA